MAFCTTRSEAAGSRKVLPVARSPPRGGALPRLASGGMRPELNPNTGRTASPPPRPWEPTESRAAAARGAAGRRKGRAALRLADWSALRRPTKPVLAEKSAAQPTRDQGSLYGNRGDRVRLAVDAELIRPFGRCWRTSMNVISRSQGVLGRDCALWLA
jgi:hypothetical protein